MRFIEQDHAVEVRPEPVEDLLEAGVLPASVGAAQGGVGGEQDALPELDRLALLGAGQRHDLEFFLAERRPVALRVFEKLVGFRDPERAAAALQPVVEHNASRLPALAAARAVAKKIAFAELHRAFGLWRDAVQPVEALIGLVMAGQKTLMGFAGIDDRLDLRVGQDAFRDQIARQPRHIGWHRRRDGAPWTPIAQARSDAAWRLQWRWSERHRAHRACRWSAPPPRLWFCADR